MNITIKPLVWHESTGQMAHACEPFPNFKYVIVDDDRGVDWSIGGNGWNPVDNVESAKTAAQADYEARIRSTFEPVEFAPIVVGEQTIARLRNGLAIEFDNGLALMPASDLTPAPAMQAENERLRAVLANAPDRRHFEILAEAMSEVKATNDGQSDQTITEIVDGCLAEIAALERKP